MTSIRARVPQALPVLLPSLVAVAALAAGCGGGGGTAPKVASQGLLYAKSFNLPNYSGVFQDEDLVFRFSCPVKEDSINPDSIQVRTGATAGITPYGVFVRGEFLIDPATGNRVVIDPEGASENLINRVESSGDISRLPDSIRIDGSVSPEPEDHNGFRQPLFDRSRESVVTFVPEVPTRAALDDAGFSAGSVYTVSVPGYPSTNTLENISGNQLLNPNNRVFTSTFSTVSSTSTIRFLCPELSGLPRIIHSEPYNGAVNVPIDQVIAVRFSHPLDPRTVNILSIKVELVSIAVAQPIPVSIFLAQQRLGKCEVILSPIDPLPANGTIRVTIDRTVEDLFGQSFQTQYFSFFTGAPGPTDTGFIPPANRDFGTNDDEDVAGTTANWNDTKPQVGGVAGQLTAAFAPYAGDGSDGAFSAPSGQTTVLDTGNLVQRVYNYTTFSVPVGAIVQVTGNHPLVIRCQGAVDVSGTMLLDGGNGGHGLQGDASASPVTGGAGGTAGPGGGAGGAGAMRTAGAGFIDASNGVGSGGGKGGFTGEQDKNWTGAQSFWPRTTYTGSAQTCTTPLSFEPCRQREGGGGGGFRTAGTNSDNMGATLLVRDGAASPNGGLGGIVNGTAAFSAASTNAVVEVWDPGSSSLVTQTLTGVPTMVAGMGGSGAGGGGGEDDATITGSTLDQTLFGVADGSDEGGGGGGGGGGALQITTYTTINVAGTISCKGGKGGGSYTDGTFSAFSQGAGGGGGSGGAIWLQARGAMTVQAGAVMDVTGGAGGQGRADGSTLVYTAGTGGAGRVRLEDSDGVVANSPANSSVAAFVATIDLESEALSNWLSTGIFTPNFTSATVTASVLPDASSGSIQVYLEGAPENVATTNVADPDESLSTGLVLIYDSDQGGAIAGSPWDALDNYKWYRFKVLFTVSASHTFTDPMPMVDSIDIVYTQ